MISRFVTYPRVPLPNRKHGHHKVLYKRATEFIYRGRWSQRWTTGRLQSSSHRSTPSAPKKSSRAPHPFFRSKVDGVVPETLHVNVWKVDQGTLKTLTSHHKRAVRPHILISQNVFINYFQQVNSHTKSSSYCCLFLVEMLS